LLLQIPDPRRSAEKEVAFDFFRTTYRAQPLCYASNSATKTAMPENKTKPTAASVTAYIAALTDATQRSDAKQLAQLMQRASGEKPKLWGPSIIGFGTHHYKYESGREGDAPQIAFSPRKSALVLYGMLCNGKADTLLAKLGKHTTGKGCLYIKKLSDVDQGALESLIANAVAHHGA
jgi:hypothetical protein